MISFSNDAQIIFNMNQRIKIIIVVVIACILIEAQPISLHQGDFLGNNIKITANNVSIFGIRWRFGDAFNPEQTRHNSQHYILQFNSNVSLNAQTYVKFQNAKYACGQQDFTFDNATTFLHTCRINQQLMLPYEYQIIKKEIAFSGLDQGTHINSLHETLLFSGKLRMPKNGLSMLILGDLIFKDNEILPCNINDVLESQEVSMVAIGNIYSSINQHNFAEILSLLQPITSQAITIPFGRSDEPNSPLYQICFPFSFSLEENDYSVISFEQFNFTIYIVNSHASISSMRLNGDEWLQNQLILAMSPSGLTENSYFLQSVKIDIHVSPQNSGQYENKNVCYHDQKQNDHQQINTKNCPFMISEGRADLINRKQDYGILKVRKGQNQQNGLSFVHYDECAPSDHFQIEYENEADQQSGDAANKDRNNIIRKLIISAEYIFVIVIVVFLITSFISLRRRSKPKKDDNHIELVDQIATNSQKPSD